MRVKRYLQIIALVLGISGACMICHFGNWELAIGIGLVLWADNIDKALKEKP